MDSQGPGKMTHKVLKYLWIRGISNTTLYTAVLLCLGSPTAQLTILSLQLLYYCFFVTISYTSKKKSYKKPVPR